MDRIDAMQAFVAVADLAGFAPAARKLGLSASAITRLVAGLEERLGARLLQRTTRSVTLTDVGERYLERARRILGDVEEAEASAQAERTQPSGRLVVSAPLVFGRLHVGHTDVGLSEAVSGRQRRTAVVGPHDEISSMRRSMSRFASGTSRIPVLVARNVGDMRQLVVASPGYLKERGTP